MTQADPPPGWVEVFHHKCGGLLCYRTPNRPTHSAYIILPDGARPNPHSILNLPCDRCGKVIINRHQTATEETHVISCTPRT